MSEKINTSSEVEAKDTSPYEGFDRDTLDAIAAARESVDAESSTPNADLRQAVRGALEDKGDNRAFRRVYDMNNLDLQAFVDGASGELKSRRVDELKSIIDAYDSNETFGDRRTALREALEAAGDDRAFRRVYDMNNLDITSFVNDARKELQDETSLSEEEALNEAYTEYEEREGTPYDVDKDRVKDPEEARVLADVERVINTVKSNPEAAEKAGVYDKIEELIAQIDAALAASKAKEEIKTPKDADEEEEIKTPKDGDELIDEEEIKTPKDGDLDDDEEIKTPKDADEEEEIKTPKDGDELIDEADDDEEEEPRRRGNIFSRAWARLNMAYAERGGTPAGVVAHGIERFRSTRKGKVVVVVGALALVGVAILGRQQGWFDGGHHGGGSGAGQPDTPSGHEGGHPGGDTPIDTSPIETGPQIPSGENYAHPWNWMEAAIDNGSITPPKGMGTEQALHYYGEKAAAAGHKVEWYNLPNGLEAIRVDGSDSTKVVGDVLSQFAK